MINVMRKPYLIQRAVIEPSRSIKNKISDVVRFEYMGSAEYEFGAMPKSLRVLQKHKDDIKVLEVMTKFGRPIYILHALENVQPYVDEMIELAKGKTHLKESADFFFYDKMINQQKKYRFMRTNLWWDLENHVFFSYNKKFMYELLGYLENSWRYMDEQAG